MTQPTPQDAALSAARRFCGWHVTPEREDEDVVFDGPGARLLALPTLRLVELTAVIEDGVVLDPVTDLEVSARGLVRKRNGGWWSGRYGAITVSMTHGFDADAAADFNAAVASFAERHAAGDKPRVVGPVQWDSVAMSPGSAFSVVERSLLEQYRLESAP